MPARVLIVDDSPLARRVLREQLIASGYAIAGEAGDGLEAVAKYQQLRPEIVTMDVQMPKLDGLEALRRILAIDPAARVVFVSAIGSEATVVQAIRAGAKGYVLKPTERVRLAEALARLAAPKKVLFRREWQQDEKELELLFLQDAERQIELFEQRLEQLRQAPADPRPVLDDLSRAVHSLKGAGAMMDHDSFVEICNGLGKLLGRLQTDELAISRELLDLLAESGKTLHNLLASLEQDAGSVYAQSLAWRIESWVGAANRQASPTAAPASRVLIVDDDGFTRRSVEGFLLREGFEVYTAKDGYEGVSRAIELRPALILLDVVMPRMDGFAVCRLLRENPVTADIPILIMTVKSALADKLQGFRSGADDYVTKPFEPEEVLARVQALLKRAAPHRG